MRIDSSAGITTPDTHIDKTSSSHPAQSSAARSDESQSFESSPSIGDLTATVLNAPEVRTERIQALQSRLESGSYEVSAMQTAGSMLEQMRIRAS